MSADAHGMPGTVTARPLQQELRSIAVFRPLHLGDLLCAVPALRALRAAAPRAHIALVGLPWARIFVDRFHAYVDELIEYPFGEMLPDADSADGSLTRDFFDGMRARRFDLAVQMHGDGSRSNAVVAAFGARAWGGYVAGAAAQPLQLAWQRAEPEVDRCLRLVEHLGAAPGSRTLEFPLRDAERQGAAALRAAAGVRDRYVCLHPGARLRSRRWPVGRFAAVAAMLRRDGLPIVMTGSPAETTLTYEIVRQLRRPSGVASKPPLVDLAGYTSLGMLAGLIADASVLISNDTGVAHIAGALGTPSVIVSCGSDTHRRAPQDGTLHHVIAGDARCRPCTYDACPNGHVCATAIEPATVLSHVRQLVAAGRSRAA